MGFKGGKLLRNSQDVGRVEGYPSDPYASIRMASVIFQSTKHGQANLVVCGRCWQMVAAELCNKNN